MNFLITGKNSPPAPPATVPFTVTYPYASLPVIPPPKKPPSSPNSPARFTSSTVARNACVQSHGRSCPRPEKVDDLNYLSGYLTDEQGKMTGVQLTDTKTGETSELEEAYLWHRPYPKHWLFAGTGAKRTTVAMSRKDGAALRSKAFLPQVMSVIPPTARRLPRRYGLYGSLGSRALY